MSPPDGTSIRGSDEAARTGGTLAPGEVVADRFEVMRHVGRGGMGDVYEVEDRLLGGRVALKTIRSEAAGDASAVERFQREVQLARKVAHPNVCQTFDLGLHQAADGSPPVRFVTMELLAGETLAARIDREGPLPAEPAQSIAEQIAAGLQAAHEAGVIHHDLKSDNVTLVPSGGGVRAVVTDFGLARIQAAGAAGSGAGTLAGTPAYMAPEQVAGRGVTVASDVYALGVVLYEMVTGTLPFPGRSLREAARRLKDPAPSPRTQVPALDARWEAVILRCLERDPLDRFASAADVARALRGEEVAPSLRAVVERHDRKRRGKRIVLALTLLAALSVGGLLVHRLATPRAAPQRRSVAVLGFKNLSGRAEAAWLSTALAEMLTAELGAGEKLRMVPGETVARIKAELRLPDADLLAEDTLERAGRNLGSDFVLLGSYLATGAQAARLRVDLRVQETRSGRTLALITEEATEEGLPELVTRAGERLRERLQVGAVSAGEVGSARGVSPAGAEATRLYAEGLARLRLFDALTARDLLEKAVEADPESPLAHSALAEAWGVLGYDAKARDAAKRAFDLSAKLPREQRLFVEGRYREAARERDKAVDAYRALFGFFPDNVEYGLRLAAVQTAAGKGREALVTLEALRSLGVPISEDPRIDLAEAEAVDSLSEYRRAQAVAAKAVAKGAGWGARILMARGHYARAGALYRLGEYPQAIAAAEQAGRLFAEMGDRAGAASSLVLSGVAHYREGALTAARTPLEEALAVYREIGNRLGEAIALNTIAYVLSDQGDLPRARTLHEQSLAIAREIDHRRSASISLGHLGMILRQQGDLSGAKGAGEEGLAIAREVGDRRRVVHGLVGLGDVLREQGDLAGARRRYDEALAISREIGGKLEAGMTLRALGDLLTALGDLAAARKVYDEALAVRTESGAKLAAAGTRVALAVLAIEEGRPAEAEGPAREAAAELGKEKRVDEEARALTVLARSLVAQGRANDAREALARAVAAGGSSHDLDVLLGLAMTSARVRAATGQALEGAKDLETALAQAEKAGFVAASLEIRLVVGVCEQNASRREAGRARLLALASDAEAKGFGLVARQAREAAR